MQFEFNPDKNQLLLKHRGISFEQVIVWIESGMMVDVRAHHNPSKYPHQYVIEIEVNDYRYLVPCEITQNVVVLKTIYPSRKATKKARKKP